MFHPAQHRIDASRLELVAAARSLFDFVQELITVRRGFIEDTKCKELYPAALWARLLTAATALTTHVRIDI
jgi:hypothetical protein